MGYLSGAEINFGPQQAHLSKLEVKERASQFLQHGIKPLDALHLALAEASKADYFCTCDDQLAHKARRIGDLQVKVISPLDLIQEIEK